jgi:hypothetical protein
LLEQGEEELRAARAWWYLAVNLNMQAAVTLPQGDYARAAELLRASLDISRRLRDTWALPYALDGLATIALSTGHPEHAARLMAAAEALREPLGNDAANAVWRDLLRQHVARLETMVDQETLARLWAEGRALRIDQAIELALSSADT